MKRNSPASAQKQMSESTAKMLIELNSCLAYLETCGRLVRVRSTVSSRHELAGIARHYEGDKCVLFERVRGNRYPVFIGMLWNRETVGKLFKMPWEKVSFKISGAIGSWHKNKKKLRSPVLAKGPANEVVEENVNLYKLPIPVHALKDGGRYLDNSVVVAKNPETGIANSSIHRMMVSRKDRLTFLIDPGRHLGAYLDIMEKRNQPLPVTINNGIGLAPWLTSIIPAQGDGKYTIANHIIGRPIKFINAQTVDVPAYADAQFVIEAEILPNIREKEGPFAEVTGYYASGAKRWVMRVLAVTHRKNAVFHSLLPGQEVWNAVGFTAEAKIFNIVKQKIPQLEAVYLDHGGCGFYGAVIRVKKSRAGIAKAAIKETFNAFEPLQRVVAVDADVNLYDPNDVNWAITTRFNPDKDLIIIPNQKGHILNPMVKINPDGKGGTVTKMGIDATAPYPMTDTFRRVDFMKVDLKNYKIDE